MVAGPTRRCQSQPSHAIKKALEAAKLTLADVDLFEINEAFAAVAIQSMRDLGVTYDIVNVNGGAIALGHPVGMSGARIVLHLINELRRRGGGLGCRRHCAAVAARATPCSSACPPRLDKPDRGPRVHAGAITTLARHEVQRGY